MCEWEREEREGERERFRYSETKIKISCSVGQVPCERPQGHCPAGGSVPHPGRGQRVRGVLGEGQGAGGGGGVRRERGGEVGGGSAGDHFHSRAWRCPGPGPEREESGTSALSKPRLASESAPPNANQMPFGFADWATPFALLGAPPPKKKQQASLR